MINVFFFAQVRELTGVDAERVAAEFATVEALREHLAARGGRFALALESGKLLAAVNQTLVPFDHPLADGDEVAFFPPVTGG
ncbi:molybdopterin synthase sulfur carrier subunit [Cronobacter dublinensis]|uniref:molybdopterin synthase sulfur carrier subunit n=1 Tax=Cronobacter dublinensis TaxID=413497 RepID=UPI0035159238